MEMSDDDMSFDDNNGQEHVNDSVKMSDDSLSSSESDDGYALEAQVDVIDDEETDDDEDCDGDGDANAGDGGDDDDDDDGDISDDGDMDGDENVCGGDDGDDDDDDFSEDGVFLSGIAAGRGVNGDGSGSNDQMNPEAGTSDDEEDDDDDLDSEVGDVIDIREAIVDDGDGDSDGDGDGDGRDFNMGETGGLFSGDDLLDDAVSSPNPVDGTLSGSEGLSELGCHPYVNGQHEDSATHEDEDNDSVYESGEEHDDVSDGDGDGDGDIEESMADVLRRGLGHDEDGSSQIEGSGGDGDGDGSDESETASSLHGGETVGDESAILKEGHSQHGVRYDEDGDEDDGEGVDFEESLGSEDTPYDDDDDEPVFSSLFHNRKRRVAERDNDMETATATRKRHRIEDQNSPGRENARVCDGDGDGRNV